MRLDSRLATFLLEERRRCGSDTIPMTQDQVASCINSAREVVARMLKSFVEDGLVTVARGKICLTNVSSLEALL